MASSVGALIMAYGSPFSLDEKDVFEYLCHILMHYRKTKPTQEELQHLKDRYAAIGGSPLYSITEQIAEAVQDTLDMESPGRFKVFMAMKHSPPLIEDVVKKISDSGLKQAVAVALAPFRSRLSSDAYYEIVRHTNDQLDRPLQWSYAGDWHLHPLFLELWSKSIEEALRKYDEAPMVIFTNHSLPAHIQEWDDPYARQFEMTAQALAKMCGLTRWTSAFQSDGGGNQPWLGPRLLDVILEAKAAGTVTFLLAPIGFLMDHLEILYDLDVEEQAEAKKAGISLERTAMPNHHPLLMSLLANLIREGSTDD